MRRIIERVVTVVTTTTWTISWQADTPPGDPQADPAPEEFSKAEGAHETAKHIQKFSSVVTKKEADETETNTETDPSADEPPYNTHLSKIERK